MPSVSGAELTAYQAFTTTFFDMAVLVTGSVTAPNPDTLIAQSLDGTRVITLTGVDLVYDPAGGIIDGTVSAILVAVDGAPAVEVTGIDILLADLVALAEPGGGDAVYNAMLSGGDTLTGSGGADMLLGSTGRDKLDGNDGDDTIYGGGDRDRLGGGDGADVFYFGDMYESAANRRGRDTILDFDRAEGDLIDLTGLGLLTFMDGDEFTGGPGEIIATATRRGMLVEVDLDGDLDADFSIMVNGVTTMRATDFVVLALE